jgi:hypothetical protein
VTSIDRRISITLIGCLWLASFPRAEFDGSVAAQERRPVLRPVRRDYFAGRLLLIPRDTRAASFHSLRQLARLADHDLILPPAMRLDHPSNLLAWARQQDYGDLDGVIISLESLGESPSSLLDEIRSRRPRLRLLRVSRSCVGAAGVGPARSSPARVTED